jgi:H+-translocating NAD(P) transhydrogenase subunit alpha
MKIAIIKEPDTAESRVAGTPDTVKKLMTRGFEVCVETGAGVASAISDADFEAAGASIAKNASSALKDADVVLAVRRPDTLVKHFKSGAVLVCQLDPYGHEEALQRFADAGVMTCAMELMPRVTRAQVMDVLSSQANLAGYQAVIEASHTYGRALPMMMTAAGTVPAAKIFVMGAGVAGLQAIATARRMGAVVTATDVRPAAKEQVASLGAKFVAVEDDEFKAAETSGGYAKEMSKEYQTKQAELVATHIAKQDIVITTALIPGRPAPRLISASMVEAMRAGSVIVDMAVERGGNCELAKPGEIVMHQGVLIVGKLNLAGEIAATASQLYAKNLAAFVEILVKSEEDSLHVSLADELVTAVTVTREGAIVHPQFQPKEANA